MTAQVSAASWTALIVEVPEAEAVVHSHRLRLDATAELGVPAHVTVLFPFAPLATVDDVMLGRLTELFGRVPAYSYRFSHTSWFGDEVLWLAPDASPRFGELTRLVCEAFPGYPPYGGRYGDVIPHLTVADRRPVEEMRAAERAIQARLPVHSVVREITLMAADDSGRWRREAAFALSG
jgi:hypothetical protein